MMIVNKESLKLLNPTDLLVVAFYLFLSTLIIALSNKIDLFYLVLIFNFLLIAFIFWVAKISYNTNNNYLKILHFYYVIPIIFLSFKEIYILLHALQSADYDNVLISADRFIFGTDPTVYLYQFSTPILTEILQIAYGSFFFLPIILGLEFHLKKDFDKFNFIIFSVVFGFFLSYLGYFLLPAVGPRFTLHDFNTINLELPGIFLTNFLREIVNAGESIPRGAKNAIDFVQRDVFPSGHTQMTLIVMFLSIKLKSLNKYLFLSVGSLLIFATVYLRYHYFIDLVAGTLFMITTMVLGKYLYNWWQKKTNRQTFEY